MQDTMKLSVTEAELDSATTNVQDMLFVRQIIESMGLTVKLPMILRVDNQGVRDLINNWSVGGRTRHVATKAMFLRELKEWGVLAIEYMPGSEMSTDLFTKNLPGPLFAKHSHYYMTEDDMQAEQQQARETAGISNLAGGVVRRADLNEARGGPAVQSEGATQVDVKGYGRPLLLDIGELKEKNHEGGLIELALSG